MQPRKLKVGFAFFVYGTNGGAASEHPDIRKWAVKTAIAAKQDERIEDLYTEDFNDTPITMTRNAAVEWAKRGNLDVLVMIDSDQAPDLYPEGKPFFRSSFDFLYKHWEKGPVAIAAPYCGPPTHPTEGGGEIVYVFRWANLDTGADNPQFKQERYTREEAETRAGFEQISSGPTGLCMIDMRCFDHLTPPYFYYEYRGDGTNCPHCNQPKPGIRAEKASTEDCVFFRDLSLNGSIALGYNPVYVNWDAWAGHWKPKCVGKPESIKSDQVASTLKDVVMRGERAGMKTIRVKRGNLPVHPKDAKGADFDKTFAVNGNGHATYDTFDDFVNGKTVEAVDAVAESISDVPRMLSPDPMKWETKAEANYKLHGGTIDTTRPGIIYHPDDPRMADAIPTETPDAFREAQNTSGDDLEILRKAVMSKAYDANVNGHTLKIVELGSWVGHSAIAMAEIADQICDFEIYCVDHFEGGNALQKKVSREHNAFEEFKKNTAKYPQIKCLRGSTAEGAASWIAGQMGEADLIFVDADHSYEGCKADILNWWPMLRHTGTMIGHDFNHLFPGVRKAAMECFGWGVCTVGDLWIVKKGLDQLNTEKRSLVPAIEARHARAEGFTTEAEWLGEPSVFSDTRTLEKTP